MSVLILLNIFSMAHVFEGLGKDGKFEEQPLVRVSRATQSWSTNAPTLTPHAKVLLQRNFAGSASNVSQGYIIGGKAGKLPDRLLTALF